MALTVTFPVLEIFGVNAASPFIQLPVPNASQIAVTPGAASFNDGFPPLNFLDPSTAGGVPPRGVDFNGVLFMLSQYIAGLEAGQLRGYSAATSTFLGGYAQGAILAKANAPGFWVSTVNANVSDPDTGGANWTSFSGTPSNALTGASAVVPATGANNNLNPTGWGPTVGFVDLAPAGVCNITGWQAGFNGQRVTWRNTSAFAVTFNAENSGSSSANQFSIGAGGRILMQLDTFSARYSSQIGMWVSE